MSGTNTNEHRLNVREKPQAVRDVRELALHACFQRDPNAAPRGKRILLHPNVMTVERASRSVKRAPAMERTTARLHLHVIAIRILFLRLARVQDFRPLWTSALPTFHYTALVWVKILLWVCFICFNLSVWGIRRTVGWSANVECLFVTDFDQLNSTLGDLSSITSTSSISPSQSQPSCLPLCNTRRTAESLCQEDGSSINDGDLCACAQSALHMLEELELQYHNKMEVSSDGVLGYQKIALARLNSWLSCDHSQTPRATTKLIVLVIEGLSLYLERGVAGCIRQIRQEVEDESSYAARLCNVGDYHVESKHEWAHILRVSLLVRCRELLAAVTRLKKHDINDVLLPAVEQRLSGIIQELKGWEDYL